MKIQCDVCTKKEALVFCCADEAALCHGCDEGIHHANKLASKHQRFSLLHPPPSLAPLCDICQEKRAVLFCQEDRAILCRDCEVPLHSGNELTQKHNRYLLIGIKLSTVCHLGVAGSDPVPTFESSTKSSSGISTFEPEFSDSGNNIAVDSVNGKAVSGGSTSSISEYLIDTLPGWHFENFEDASLNFSKSGSMNEFEVDDNVLSFWDEDIIDKKLSCTNTSIQYENLGIWVPQAPIAASLYHQNQSGLNNIVQGGTKNKQDDALAVPQVTHCSDGSTKTPRSFW